jgi:pimeloyl-ACP methyl ester carboxylesterase
MKLRYCVKPLTSSKRPAISECFDGSLHVRSQTVRRLSLAYALHEPQDRQTATDQHPIIILHGLFGSKQNNRSISKAIARDLGTRVYALDLRNHGESPHHPVHDYMSMADDVQEFIQEHSLQKPTLIGHSMGAKAAMTVALRSPDKVRSLIPVDNAPVDALLQSDFAKYVQGMKKIVEAEVTKQVEADKILTTFEPASLYSLISYHGG